MLKQKKQYWFLAIEVIIYSCFLYLDFHNREYACSNHLKFAGIFLCFLTAFFSLVLGWKQKKEEERTDHQILFLAFCFTISADILLLFTDAYWQGVICFIAVQSIYFYRISNLITAEQESREAKENKKPKESNSVTGQDRKRVYIRGLLIRLALGTLCNLLFAVFEVWDIVTCVSAYYLISFIGNLYGLLKFFLKSPTARKSGWFLRFFFGMVLFFFCDISVGLYNLSDYLPYLAKGMMRFLQYAGNLMWLFYLPGQVLLSLSGKTDENR